MFKLFFRRKALNIFKKNNKAIQLKINSAIDFLIVGEFSKKDVEKIKGTENGYRLRVGRWRILLNISFDKFVLSYGRMKI